MLLLAAAVYHKRGRPGVLPGMTMPNSCAVCGHSPRGYIRTVVKLRGRTINTYMIEV